MATESSIKTERVEKLFEDLEARKTILSSCTQLFTALTSHFTSLQDSLTQKSKSLESKFLSLDSTSLQTLQSLAQRENAIPGRESAAVELVNAQKVAALAEVQKPAKFGDLSESMKSLCLRMDASFLLKFIIWKRKESMSLRPEISRAIRDSVDAPRLVLDAVDEFLVQKAEGVGVTDKRWACGMLIQAMFPEGNIGEKAVGPEFASSIIERAAGILIKWKEQMGEAELSPSEAVMFLQLVVGFGLQSRFDQAFLRKLVVDFASRRVMAKLATSLGFGQKLADIIDEFVKSGKEIEAVYFAYESGLTERFPPVSLLKSYHRNFKKNASNIMKNGNYSNAAKDESNNMELNSIKAIVKCLEDHKIESDFSIENLKRRASQIEKAKAERKKSSVTNTKPQNKRSHGASSSRGSGPPPLRPSKAAKFSNSYQSLGRRNAAPPAQVSPAARYSGPYNYPNQGVYEGHTTAHYASAYSVPHTQSPAAISQQHYSLPPVVDNMGTAAAAGFRASGSYGGQSSYGAYDYNSSAVPSSYQSSSYTQ